MVNAAVQNSRRSSRNSRPFCQNMRIIVLSESALSLVKRGRSCLRRPARYRYACRVRTLNPSRYLSRADKQTRAGVTHSKALSQGQPDEVHSSLNVMQSPPTQCPHPIRLTPKTPSPYSPSTSPSSSPPPSPVPPPSSTYS